MFKHRHSWLFLPLIILATLFGSELIASRAPNIEDLEEWFTKKSEYELQMERPEIYITAIAATSDETLLIALNHNPNWDFEDRGQGLWFTKDGGQTWQNNMEGISRREAAIYHITEDKQRGYVYIATNNGVYRSQDLETSWEGFTQGLPYENHNFLSPSVLKLSINPVNGDVYARVPLNGFGIYKTDVDSPNWEPIGDGLPEETSIDSLEYSPLDNSIYVTSGASGIIVIGPMDYSSMGVYQGKTAGNHYIWIREESLPKAVEAIKPVGELTRDHSGGIYACTYTGLYQKKDKKWTLVLDQDFVGPVAFEEDGQERAIAFSLNRGYLHTNGRWELLEETPWHSYTTVVSTLFSQGNLYVVTYEGLWTSPDGKAWMKIPLPSPRV